MTSPTHSNIARGRRGFTLIELLVSMTILAAVLGSLVAGLQMLSHGWDRNSQRMEALDMIARTVDILQRDAASLQRAVTLPGKDAEFLFAGGSGEMSFVVLEPSYPSRSGPYFIEYAGGEVNGETGLIRSRAPYHHELGTFPGATPANKAALLQGAFAFQFSYGEKTAGDIRWTSGWKDRSRLPHLIRLQITDLSEMKLVIPPIVAPIKADAELTCFSNERKPCSATQNGSLKAAAEAQAPNGRAGEP